MTTTHFSHSVNTIETAVASTSLNALGGSGSYALGAAIDNRPTDGTTIGYDMADLTITLSSAVTAGGGSPYVTVYILPAIDGTNYPTPPGGTANAAPAVLGYGFPQVASVSTSTITCPNIPIPPFLFKVMIQNSLGVAFPATNTSTCQIVRRTVANW